MARIELEAFVIENGRKRQATSKADVVRAVKANPASVIFESIGNIFTPYVDFRADNVPTEHDFTVTIYPHTRRTAFGTVKRGKDGTAVVK